MGDSTSFHETDTEDGLGFSFGKWMCAKRVPAGLAHCQMKKG